VTAPTPTTAPTPMTAPTPPGTVEDALAALRAGRPVLVTDAADREDEGDVVLAGETLTAEWMAWTIRNSSGYVCAPMSQERADALELPLMVADNADPLRTAYTVTVDARTGVTTGISAADRAHTIRALAGSGTTAADLIRPGHVVPLRARPGGVLERPGHTEAAVDLCRPAGLRPVAAIAELVSDDGTMMRLPELLDLAGRHGLPVLSIEQLIEWRAVHDRVSRVVETTIPTDDGVFAVVGYRDLLTGAEHLALVSPRGLPAAVPLVRLHSECLTGDVLGSQRCDCGPQLAAALARVAADGGTVLYLRGHEGRGVGLLNKLRAYALQDDGLDTVDAQTALGLPVDDREYAAGAAILTDLGASSVRLLTNNPLKVEGLRRHGIEVTTVEPLLAPPTLANAGYLRTKRDRMGHRFGAVSSPGDPGVTLDPRCGATQGGAR
jgi:3,4-dihydroxy 2-butanone 4-phosphate synthase/GTP cyclohydrolase II